MLTLFQKRFDFTRVVFGNCALCLLRNNGRKFELAFGPGQTTIVPDPQSARPLDKVEIARERLWDMRQEWLVPDARRKSTRDAVLDTGRWMRAARDSVVRDWPRW